MKNKTNKLKAAFPALALICAGMIVASCEKGEPDLGPTTDVEYKFSSADIGFLFHKNELNSILKYYVNHPAIRTIYLTPAINDSFWPVVDSYDISEIKRIYLETIINSSPKFRGKGDFNFKPGEASKVPNDSLWFVQNGWTINKDLQNQK